MTRKWPLPAKSVSSLTSGCPRSRKENKIYTLDQIIPARASPASLLYPNLVLPWSATIHFLSSRKMLRLTISGTPSGRRSSKGWRAIRGSGRSRRRRISSNWRSRSRRVRRSKVLSKISLDPLLHMIHRSTCRSSISNNRFRPSKTPFDLLRCSPNTNHGLAQALPLLIRSASSCCSSHSTSEARRNSPFRVSVSIAAGAQSLTLRLLSNTPLPKVRLSNSSTTGIPPPSP